MTNFERVKKFMKTFGQEIKEKASFPEDKITALRYDLIKEELGELKQAMDQKDLKEVSKILNKNSVHHEKLGIIVDKDVIINEKTKVTIDELKSYNTNWLTNYMSS